MSDDNMNPNFEWKKKNLGKKERLSRRIDAEKATLQEYENKNEFTKNFSLSATSTDSLTSNLKKIKKKIKNALEEDEDSENESFIFDELDLHNQFMAMQNDISLSSNAKKNVILQNQVLQEIKKHHDVAKTEALRTLNNMAKKSGLGELSSQDIAENMQNNAWGEDTFKMALQHKLAPNIILGNKNINPEKIKKLMKGLKRLKKIGSFNAVQGMKMNDIIKITDEQNQDAKVAELLLKKTGRKANKHKDKLETTKRGRENISFKSLIRSKKENTFTKV